MFSDSGSFVKFSFLFSFSFLVVVSCLFADRLHITQQTNFTQRVGIFSSFFSFFFFFLCCSGKTKVTHNQSKCRHARQWQEQRQRRLRLTATTATTTLTWITERSRMKTERANWTAEAKMRWLRRWLRRSVGVAKCMWGHTHTRRHTHTARETEIKSVRGVRGRHLGRCNAPTKITTTKNQYESFNESMSVCVCE